MLFPWWTISIIFKTCVKGNWPVSMLMYYTLISDNIITTVYLKYFCTESAVHILVCFKHNCTHLCYYLLSWTRTIPLVDCSYALRLSELLFSLTVSCYYFMCCVGLYCIITSHDIRVLPILVYGVADVPPSFPCTEINKVFYDLTLSLLLHYSSCSL